MSLFTEFLTASADLLEALQASLGRFEARLAANLICACLIGPGGECERSGWVCCSCLQCQRKDQAVLKHALMTVGLHVGLPYLRRCLQASKELFRLHSPPCLINLSPSFLRLCHARYYIAGCQSHPLFWTKCARL